MTTEPLPERRITRLENDTQSIYEILTDHTERFVTIDRRLDKIEGRLDGIDKRLDRMDQRLDRMDERFDRMEQSFIGLQGTLDTILSRLPEH